MADWINRSDALTAVLDAAPPLLGLDTEFMRTDTYAPKLALLQMALDGRIALIDPVAQMDFAPLAALLGDPGFTTVMHSASEDLEALSSLLPQGLGRLYDTQIAAAFAGLGAGLGYQKIVQEVIGIQLPKAQTRSDWLKRPLTAEQLEYAAHDVEHLLVLHAHLSARLERRGFTAWHAQDCARLVERARNRESDPEPQLGLRGAADWPREKQALLRRVLRWREATARELDRPRPWILDDPRALDLVHRPPADGEALFERTKGLRSLRGPQRTQLLETLHAPLAPEELDFVPIPPAPTSADKRVLAELKEVVSARAAELDVPEGLLCARRHLEVLLRTRRWPSSLEGWRRTVLHDALMSKLPDPA